MSRRLIAPFLCVFLTAIGSLIQPGALAQSTAGNPAVARTGNLHWARHGHTATLLPSGQVLVAGGGGVVCSYSGLYNRSCFISVNNTAELYDPEAGTWRLTGSLHRRGYHSATLLPNGHVLVAGGVDDGKEFGFIRRDLDTAELYDPETELWRSVQGPTAVRGPNNAVLLPGGKVLVVGHDSTNQPVAELFDPSTETWKLTGAPTLRGPLTLLPAGTVLTAANGSALLYEAATETWTSAGNFNLISAVGTLTSLRNGSVLATGQRSDWSHLTAELYDPHTRTWKLTGSLNYPSNNWTPNVTATLLSNGQVLLAGGYDSANLAPDAPSPLELYDPHTEVWKAMPNLFVRRDYHTATLLPDGKVLLATGINENYQFPVFHTSAELFDLGLPRSPWLKLNSSSYCTGDSWDMRGKTSAPNTSFRLVGMSNGQPWEIVNWRKTDESGDFRETGSFAPGSEGVHKLSLDIGGKVSNDVLLNVARCQIKLTLNLSEYCSGAPWNLKVTSDFPNASIGLSGTANNAPWEIADWGRTSNDGSFVQDGTFVPGTEGTHTLQVRIGTAQSNVFRLTVSRCGP